VISLDFLLITCGIMLIGSWLIHKLANFFGLQMKYKSLLLCALLAFGVNFVTITMSSYLTMQHFILIFGFTAAAALLVTLYNDHLLRQERLCEADTPAAIQPAPAPEPLPLASLSPVKPAKPAVPAAAADTVSMKPQIHKDAGSHPHPSLYQKPFWGLPVFYIQQGTSRRIPPVKRRVLPAKPALAAPVHLLAAPTNRLTEWSKLAAAKQFADLSASGNRRPTVSRALYLPAVPQKTIAEIVQEDMENDRLLKLTIAIAKLGSLDDILDYAYEQKQRRNDFNALFAYKRALARYHTDAYAPFIAIDIINIYKENGAYSEAIHTCLDSLQLPAVLDNPSMQQQFEHNLMYLRTIRHILARHHLVKTPFNRIPPQYAEEIETVFQNRYMKKNRIIKRRRKIP